MIEKEDHYKIDKIIALKLDIANYKFFEKSVELGIRYSPHDLTFSKCMLYGWIKDALNG